MDPERRGNPNGRARPRSDMHPLGILGATLFLASPFPAAQFRSAERLDAGPGGQGGVSGGVAVAGDHGLHVFYGDSFSAGAGFDVASSVDGRVWASAAPGVPAAVTDVGNWAAAAAGSELYLVWEDGRDGNLFCGHGGNPCTSDIYLSRSSDGGASWLATDRKVNVVGAQQGRWLRVPRIVADGDRVYVWWMQSGQGWYEPWMNRSLDRGASWQPSDTRMNFGTPANTTSGAGSDLAAQGPYVAFAWADDRNGETDVFFALSSDFGATWPNSAVRLDTQQAAGANRSWEPRVFFDPQDPARLCVTWGESGNTITGPGGYFAATSDDFGVSWASPTRVDDTSLYYNLSAKLVQVGASLRLVYTTGGAGGGVVFTRSDDLGRTWATPQRIERQALGQSNGTFWPEIATHGSRVMVAWRDGRNLTSTYDLYANWSNDGGATWSAEATKLNPEAAGSVDVYPRGLAATAEGDFAATWAVGPPGTWSTPDLYAGTARLPFLRRVGAATPGSPMHYELRGADLDEDGGVAYVLASLTGGGVVSGGIPLPGDGRVLGLDLDGLTRKIWIDLRAEHTTSVLAQGAGDTPVIPYPPFAAGVQGWAAAVVQLPGGGFGGITDTLSWVTQ